jgi:hypothetical protein
MQYNVVYIHNKVHPTAKDVPIELQRLRVGKRVDQAGVGAARERELEGSVRRRTPEQRRREGAACGRNVPVVDWRVLVFDL